MKEVIMVAGEKEIEVAWIRRCLKEQGYSSIRRKTVEAIMEELQILAICSFHVSLVVIESELLRKVSGNLVAELSESASDVPFIWLDEAKILFATKKRLPGFNQRLISAGFRLSEHISKASA